MSILQDILILLAAAAGGAVVFTREPRRQALVMSLNGLVLGLLFLALQAPDVAFSQIVVGSAALPLLFLVALASVRTSQTPEETPERRQ